MALKVKNFARSVQKRVGIPFFFQDEYLSSHQAQQRLTSPLSFGPQNIHTESAKIILEDFIRSETEDALL